MIYRTKLHIHSNFVMLSHGRSALPNCFACKKGQIFIFCHLTYKLVGKLEEKNSFQGTLFKNIIFHFVVLNFIFCKAYSSIILYAVIHPFQHFIQYFSIFDKCPKLKHSMELFFLNVRSYCLVIICPATTK